jgi:hypothetical protein
MHKKQLELMRSGLKMWPYLSSNLRLDQDPKIETFHLLYHCLTEKDQHEVKADIQGYDYFRPKRIVTLWDLLKRYQKHDVAVLFVSHSTKDAKTILSELENVFEHIMFQDDFLHSNAQNHTASLCIKEKERNLKAILEFSKDEYYLSILTVDEIAVYHETELIHKKHFIDDDMRHTLGQVLGFSIEEILMGRLLLKLDHINVECKDWMLTVLNSRFMQSIVTSHIAQFQPTFFLVFIALKQIQIEDVILHVYQRDDRDRYLDMSIDVYRAFYMEDKNNAVRL